MSNTTHLAILNEKQKNLKKRSEQCAQAQLVRHRKRRAITSSLVVAFYRKPIARTMAHHVVSFLHVGFNPSTTENTNPLDIIARHRHEAVKHVSDDPESWPLIDQFLVTEQFDWQCLGLQTFVKQIYPTLDKQIDRTRPIELRQYFENMKGKELKELCRKTPGARTSGKKNDLINQLLIFTPY